MRSAASFHDVMMPLRSLLMIASSDEATMAARRADGSTPCDIRQKHTSIAWSSLSIMATVAAVAAVAADGGLAGDLRRAQDRYGVRKRRHGVRFPESPDHSGFLASCPSCTRQWRSDCTIHARRCHTGGPGGQGVVP